MNSTLSKVYEIFISKAIICYNDYMTENRKGIKNGELIDILHKLAKEKAKEMLEDLFKEFKHSSDIDRDQSLKTLEKQLDNLSKKSI